MPVWPRQPATGILRAGRVRPPARRDCEHQGVEPVELMRPPLAVGVMGSASGVLDPEAVTRVRRLGATIAASGCTLVTGACPGFSYVAVEGAKRAGGLVVGISPALSETEHVQRFLSPIDGFDLVVYTGSGLVVVNIRTSDIVVVVGGRSGTLGEFAIAYDEGQLIGVLTDTGGVADMVAELVTRMDKDTGACAVPVAGERPNVRQKDRRRSHAPAHRPTRRRHRP
jgi:uncharacterized protein (TIGR00725 family)